MIYVDPMEAIDTLPVAAPRPTALWKNVYQTRNHGQIVSPRRFPSKGLADAWADAFFRDSPPYIVATGDDQVDLPDGSKLPFSEFLFATAWPE